MFGQPNNSVGTSAELFDSKFGQLSPWPYRPHLTSLLTRCNLAFPPIHRSERSTVTKVLDLFCCQGGAGMGYHLAGCEVVGVDLAPQPRYPFKFHQGDALAYLAKHGHEFDVIHASPPCQLFTNAQKIQKNDHPNLIAPVRDLVLALGKPYVIENVPGAPLVSPIELCGAMFDLRTYRHRLFESNVRLVAPPHPKHVAKTTKMGRRPKPGEFMHVVGNFSGVAEARLAMGIDWMTRDGLRESIPPAYTQYIAPQLIEQLTEKAA